MSKKKSGTQVSSSAWLGILLKGVTFPDRIHLLVLLIKPLSHRLFITFLKLRYSLIKAGMKLRMCLIKARIICLQRGYLPPNESKLTAKLVSWCVASINHPVEVVNVFKNSFHKVTCDLMPNDPSSATRLGKDSYSGESEKPGSLERDVR